MSYVGEWLRQANGLDPDLYADLPGVAVQWTKRADGWYCRIKTARPRKWGPDGPVPDDDNDP